MYLNFKYVFFGLLVVNIFAISVFVLYSYFQNGHKPVNQISEIHQQTDETTTDLVNEDNILNSQRIRIFCLILTTTSTIVTKGKAVYEGWAKKCDKTKFVLKFPSNFVNDNPLLHFADFNYKVNGTIDVNHLLEPDQLPEESGHSYKVTVKVFRTLAYIYKVYDNYDWYLKADDDTFIFMDNLRKFLADKDRNFPITYGYNFAKKVPRGYHSGGAGYVLSHEAMRKIGQRLVTANNNTCKMSGIEDKDVALCLRNMNIYMGNSTDELGRERFHPLNIRAHIFGNFPKWLFRFSENTPQSV